MSTKVQINMIRALGPSNPNRDELGNPKMSVVGGAHRMRMSSQAIKRAMVSSHHFQDQETAFQTVCFPRELSERAEYQEYPLHDRVIAAAFIASAFDNADFKMEKTYKSPDKALQKVLESEGKAQSNDPRHFQATQRLTDNEIKVLTEVFEDLIQNPENFTNAKAKEYTTQIQESHSANLELALFGRMLSNDASRSVESSVQISHALGTSETESQDDFFTAIDSFNSDNKGAAHMGTHQFISSAVYQYACVDLDELTENLNGDRPRALEGIKAFIKAFISTTPNGKQNTMASRPLADYVLVTVTEGQPVSLDAAFMQPITGTNQTAKSIERLQTYASSLKRAYGTELSWDFQTELDLAKGEGSLDEIFARLDERLSGIRRVA
jgi:CRISPR system Cascade subunit CasC